MGETTNGVDRLWLRQSLIRGEGLRTKPYDDKTGKELRPGQTLQGQLTIAVGRNLTDVGLTEGECLYLLANDEERAIADATKLPPWGRLDAARRSVLVEMVFNLGLPKLLQFRQMIAALGRGDADAAAREMLDSLWARQVGARAERLARMMRTGRLEGR